MKTGNQSPTMTTADAILRSLRRAALLYDEKDLPKLVVNLKDASPMVLVPAGEFEMGDGQESDCPKHSVHLDAYYLGLYCVTNRQYGKFVEETGHRAPDNNRWEQADLADHPVTDVSWDDATAYAEWAGCTLPTEAQWEKAARGPQGFIYPWGNEWKQSKCRNNENKGSGQTCRVYDYPEGVSGYGTYNQSGNVWEWCADWYDEDYYGKSPGENPSGPEGGSRRVSRGGGWGRDGASDCRGADRDWCDPGRRGGVMGFRLARIVP